MISLLAKLIDGSAVQILTMATASDAHKNSKLKGAIPFTRSNFHRLRHTHGATVL
jgi:hypothetical protein